MRKLLLVLFSFLLVITGCTAGEEKEEETIEKFEKEMQQFVGEAIGIRENKTIEDNTSFVYPDSPYEKYLEFYITQKDELREANPEIETTVELVDFRLVDYDENTLILYVREIVTNNKLRSKQPLYDELEEEVDQVVENDEKATEENSTSFSVNMDYYYILKSDKKEWKIYDYIPASVVEDESKLIEEYKGEEK